MRDVIDGVAQPANFRQFPIGRYEGKRILQRLQLLVNRMHAIASFVTLRLALRRASRRVDRRVRSRGRGKRSAIATASVQVVRVTSRPSVRFLSAARNRYFAPNSGARRQRLFTSRGEEENCAGGREACPY